MNFHFHCISAPNHPGKGLDPPKPKPSKCPFDLGKFFSKKVPQTIRAPLRAMPKCPPREFEWGFPKTINYYYYYKNIIEIKLRGASIELITFVTIIAN